MWTQYQILRFETPYSLIRNTLEAIGKINDDYIYFFEKTEFLYCVNLFKGQPKHQLNMGSKTFIYVGKNMNYIQSTA